MRTNLQDKRVEDISANQTGNQFFWKSFLFSFEKSFAGEIQISDNFKAPVSNDCLASSQSIRNLYLRGHSNIM